MQSVKTSIDFLRNNRDCDDLLSNLFLHAPKDSSLSGYVDFLKNEFFDYGVELGRFLVKKQFISVELNSKLFERQKFLKSLNEMWEIISHFNQQSISQLEEFQFILLQISEEYGFDAREFLEKSKILKEIQNKIENLTKTEDQRNFQNNWDSQKTHSSLQQTDSKIHQIEENVFSLKNKKNCLLEKIEENNKKRFQVSEEKHSSKNSSKIENPFYAQKLELEKKFMINIESTKQKIEECLKAAKAAKNKKEAEDQNKNKDELENRLKKLKIDYQRDLGSVELNIKMIDDMNKSNAAFFEDNDLLIKESLKEETGNLEEENAKIEQELDLCEKAIRDSEKELTGLRKERERLGIEKQKLENQDKAEGGCQMRKIEEMRAEHKKLEMEIQRIETKYGVSSGNLLVDLEKKLRDSIPAINGKITHLKEVTRFFDDLKRNVLKDENFNELKKLDEIN